MTRQEETTMGAQEEESGFCTCGCHYDDYTGPYPCGVCDCPDLGQPEELHEW